MNCIYKKLTSTFSLAAVLWLICCSSGWGQASLPAFSPAAIPPAPDYAQKENWLACPPNPDPGKVDVFWVYPTVLMDDSHWLQDVNDRETLGAAQRTIERQASVFAGKTNLYAPFYRQANLAVLSLDPKARDEVMKICLEDVGRAFDYYLKHLNLNRPFILAGHSQGSDMLIEMAVEKWGRTGAEDRLVAAYLIGWSITQEDLLENKALTICREARQINCFISYNSVAPGLQDKAPTILPRAVAVNPISWKTDSILAPAADNLGSVFFREDGSCQTITGFASAQVQGGGLAVTAKDPSLLKSPSASFPEGVYHAFDYSLFYENLKANVEERIRAFRDAK